MSILLKHWDEKIPKGEMMTFNEPEEDMFKDLTWNDIEDWAGSRVLLRGKQYQRGKLVKRLAITPTGGLIADVTGGSMYTTNVEFGDEGLESHCTCPYRASCKHAVAVVLEYLEQTKKCANVPPMGNNDPRLNAIMERHDDSRDDEDLYDDKEDRAKYGKMPNRSNNSEPHHVKDFLKNMSKDELVTLFLEQAGKHPAVFEDIEHRRRLLKGDIQKIASTIRKEIRSLNSEPAWRNHWNNEGYIPDYSRIRNRLESLLSADHADTVITLGKELLTAGVEQVETSRDEGETAEEIASCLDIVFRAFSQSSLSPVEQMIWVIDADLEDDFGLCEGAKYFWEIEKEASHWSAVADELLRRLKHLKSAGRDDEFSRNYKRDRLSDWLIKAFQKAGRHEEIIPLCEREALRTGSYIRLVNILLDAERKEDAERWIARGIAASQEKFPGIATELRNTLRKIREKEKDWRAVAAIRADEFFSSPSLDAYENLRYPSEQAGLWSTIRAALLGYLETGNLPFSDPSWPLPKAEATPSPSRQREEPPIIHVLIDIAIDEKDVDKVIKWYDYPVEKDRYRRRWSERMEDRIATSIQKSYPDRAAIIWKDIAEEQISFVKPSAYEAAVVYLKKLQRLLIGLDRNEEWLRYMAGLRQIHARKSRLLQTLARLEGRKIIDDKG